MRYKLLKDLPLVKAGTEVFLKPRSPSMLGIGLYENFVLGTEIANIQEKDIPEWLEDIKEKKTFDDLKYGDDTYRIQSDGTTGCYLGYNGQCRSETFVTREEAEDEHKRREWRVRKDKFIPKEGEVFFTAIIDLTIDFRTFDSKIPFYVFCVNSGLAFRTEEEAEKAFEEHDLKRLFYTII